jgi:hypothetical protein
MCRLRYRAFLQLVFPAKLAPKCPFPYVWGAWGGGFGCLSGCGPCRSGGFGSGLLTTQDARVRGDSHDEVPMKPTMYGWLVTNMTKASRKRGAPDGDDGNIEPMWSLELASSWARLDAACRSYALVESETPITTALAMLPPKRPTVARADCVATARSNNVQIARCVDGMALLVFLHARSTSPPIDSG